MNEVTIKSMATRLVEVAELESGYKAERVALETEIAAAVAKKDEGTEYANIGGYQIKVVSKLTRTLDFDAYSAIADSLPVTLRCVDMKPALNLRVLKALELVDPSLTATFITTKPAKPAVSITMEEAA
jgi:hypothetical protein